MLKGFLGFFTYWDKEGFESKVWSVRVLITSLKSSDPIYRVAKVHVFDLASDDPTGKAPFDMPRPTIRMVLTDPASSEMDTTDAHSRLTP